MIFRKLSVAIVLFFAAIVSAYAQNDTVGLKTIINKTVKLANVHPIEKVYLHFDKPYYAIGDTIWLKAYITIDLHQPSPLSKIVYVDVISYKDSLVQTLKLQASNSTAIGNVILAAPLYKQGNYHFRAYTNYMRNDPDYFFNKTIPVGNPNKPVVTNFTVFGSTKSNVTKVTAKVVFKDADGKPYANKKVTWKVISADDDNISKGKGNTDANGILPVTFSSNKTAALPGSSLSTVIEVSDEKSVSSTFSLSHIADQPDVQFFPEGGDLINEVRSRVAFKAIGPDGLGIAIKGNITDNSGTVVADLTTQHLGMGLFALVPEAGKTYKANITFPDGSQNTYNLPAAKPEGITLSAYNTDPANITLKFSANSAFFQKYQNRPVYILGSVGETVCFAAQTILTSNVYSAPIAKTKFPTGVVKLTLFTDHGEPLSERIVFVQRNDALNVTMATPKPTYSPREKVTMNVAAKSPAGAPALADLSVTVIDEGKVPFDENNEITILTDLLLTSELKGYIEKPNYYFNKPDEKKAADLDLLMLTQGYRRFSFKDIIANKYPENKFLPEKGVTISGTIRNSTGLPIAKGIVNLGITGKPLAYNVLANNLGEFKFTNLVYPDSTKLTINAKNNPNANNMLIILDNENFQPITPNINAPDGITAIDSTLGPYLKNKKLAELNSNVLKTVNITAKKVEKKPSHEDYPSLIGLSMEPDQLITGDHLNACNVLYQCLQSSAFGLTYADNKLYVTRAYNAGKKIPVAIYLNGLAVDFEYLQNVESADVESVEVFLNDGVSGINRMSETNGVLVVNTKKVVVKKQSRDEINALLAPQYSAVNTIFKGYTQARVFYSPKYDAAKTISTGPDYRSTIYWNPKILTDKTGSASMEFYNADARGSYRAIIEGIDSEGNIGRYVYHYKVQ